jgi:hypothetical protein
LRICSTDDAGFLIQNDQRQKRKDEAAAGKSHELQYFVHLDDDKECELPSFSHQICTAVTDPLLELHRRRARWEIPPQAYKRGCIQARSSRKLIDTQLQLPFSLDVYYDKDKHTKAQLISLKMLFRHFVAGTCCAW